MLKSACIVWMASLLVPITFFGMMRYRVFKIAVEAARNDTLMVVAVTPGAVAPPLFPCQAGSQGGA